MTWQDDSLTRLGIRFLDIPDAHNPIALLGASLDGIDSGGPGEVVRALEHRLGQIDRHPERATPQADELRLALHAVAAQMLDPVVRTRIIKVWGGVPVSLAPRPMEALRSAGDEGPEAALVGARLSLEGDALLAIAMEGGWNQRSLERLCVFAHARGLTADDVAATLRALGRAPGAGRESSSTRGSAARSPKGPRPFPLPMTSQASASRPEIPHPPHSSRVHMASSEVSEERMIGPKVRPEPAMRTEPRLFELSPEELAAMGRRRLRLALGIAAGVAMGLFAVTTGVLIVWKGMDRPGQVVEVPAEARDPTTPLSQTPRGPDTTKKPESKPGATPVADRRDAESTRRLLEEASSLTSTDAAEAGRRFEAALTRAAGEWPLWKADELATVTEAVVEYLYKVTEDSAASRGAAAAMTGLTQPGRGVRVESFGSGLLSRVLTESNLPAGVLGQVRLALSKSAGTDQGLDTFAAGATSGLAVIALRLAGLGDPAAWKEWLECVDALHSGDAAPRGRVIAVALDQALTAGPDPVAQRGAWDSIAALGLSLSWRVEEQSRPWMLRWFDTPTVSVPALHALTTALASRSGAEGISGTMTLAALAGPGERAELRARYASAWGLGGAAAGDGFAAEWLAALGGVKAEPAASADGGAGSVDALMRAVAFSRLSEAAGLSWVGEGARARTLVTDPDALAKLRVAATKGRGVASAGGKLSGADNDGAWAAKYLGAMNSTPVRLEMLKQAQSAGALTAVECELVATEAIRGTPVAVRSLARDVVRKHIGLFAMINALLELTPMMPISADNAELVEFAALGTRMPPLRDPNWRVAARRALVQELLAKAAGTGETGGIDALAAVLGESYKNRLSALGGTSGVGDVSDARTLMTLASTLRTRWDHDAQRATPSGREVSTLVEIRKRAASRGAVAANIVQRFVAEQFACVELMAYVVVAEEPGRAARVSEVMSAFTAQRRAAKHITGQVLAGEATMAELWAVRLGA